MTRMILLCTAFLLLQSTLPAEWKQIDGPYGGPVNAMTMVGSVILAGTNGAGVFRSTDLGASWSQTDLNNVSVLSLTRQSDRVLAGTDKGIFVSGDGGIHWSPITPEGSPMYAAAIACVGTHLYAGLFGGMLRSSDDGATWNPVDGVPSSVWINAITSLGGTIFVGTNGSGVYRSTDSGKTWTSVRTGLTNLTVGAIAAAGNTILAGTGHGVFRSTDNGTTWKPTEFPNEEVRAVAFSGTKVYAASSRSVYQSADDGATWLSMNFPSQYNPHIQAIAVYGSKIFTGTNVGVIMTSTGGISWTQANTGLNNLPIGSLAVAGSVTYAGSDYQSYSSSDQRKHWVPMGLTGSVRGFVPIGDTLFAGISGGGVMRHPDIWMFWEQAINGMTNIDVSCLLSHRGRLIAGTAGGIFISSDKGASWTASNSGLANVMVNAVVVNDTEMYAGTNGGVYRSSDGGTTWGSAGTGVAGRKINSLAIAGRDVYAGTEHGVYHSADRGSSWEQSGNSVLTMPVLCLVESGSLIFAGTLRKGIYMSADHGTTWTSCGMADMTINCMAFDGSDLLAGTQGRGVWSRSLSEMVTHADAVAASVPDRMLLHQNYPNPFNPQTTIAFTLADRAQVLLHIVNALGEEIATLESGDLSRGTYTRVWNAAGLPSGVYFCRLRAGTASVTRKLMFLQ